MVSNTQSSMVNIKTILPLADVQRKVCTLWPTCVFVGATHEDTDTKHCHCVVRWELPTRWTQLAEWLDTHDPNNYCRPARSWRRSLRYLLHMDNPEKARIPRANLSSSDTIDDDELDMILGSAKLRILDSLIAAQTLPLDQRFRFLVEQRGHQPSEVSAAIRCLLDLEKWAQTRCGAPSSLPVSDSPADDDFPSDDMPDDNDDDYGDFYD